MVALATFALARRARGFVAPRVRRVHSVRAAATTTESRFITDHPDCNVTPYIADLVGRDLHKIPKHPLNTIKARIEAYFATLDEDYELFDGEDPIVTTTQCFDDLNIPPEHPGRSPSDTYYVDAERVLRTHTSAHQSEHLRGGHERFLCTGDVYRRDEIDAYQAVWIIKDRLCFLEE